MLKRAAPRGLSAIAPAVAVAGAALLVYWTSTARPMWVDEEMLALNVRSRGFAHLGGALWLDQSAPLGWLTLERAVMMVFGTSERAVRLLTTIYGCGTLAIAAWVGRRWMNALGATVLVALCGVGEWIVFFTLELKHYSADTFWALGVPALAAWALDARADPRLLRKRASIWWVVAAAGIWFGNGAVFVAPACAAVLFLALVRRGGWRLAIQFAATGFVWLASFTLSYATVLRHALGNAYLQNYWSFAFPPVSEGVAATLRWLIAQLVPFAVKPAGSGLPHLFWTAWCCGIVFAIARRRAVGLMFALVPISAFMLAVFHVVPTFERLALWVVPALYVGVALCADGGAWLVGQRLLGRRPLVLATGVAAAVLAASVCVDVIAHGITALEHRPRSNYGLDDRSSVRWLLAAHRPGDVILTTHFGLAAIWWYGGFDISDPDRTGQLPDGTPLYEIGHAPPEEDCGHWRRQLNAILEQHNRAVVYLGFRLNVLPVGYDNFVLKELGHRGEMAAYKPFAEKSRLAVFDLGRPSRRDVFAPGEDTGVPLEIPSGCMTITRARRW
jgi:hypothetical protein